MFDRSGPFPEIQVHYSPWSRLFFVCLSGGPATVFGEPGEFVGNKDEIVGKGGRHGSQSKACCKKSCVPYRTRTGCRVPVGRGLSRNAHHLSPCPGSGTPCHSGGRQYTIARLGRRSRQDTLDDLVGRCVGLAAQLVA